MKQSIFVVALSLCFIGLSAAGPYAGVDRLQPPKASATVDLLPGRAKVVVHITNDSKVALEAWQIHLEYDMAGGLTNAIDITTDTCFDSTDSGTPGRGPILPAASRDLTFALAAVPLRPPWRCACCCLLTSPLKGKKMRFLSFSSNENCMQKPSASGLMCYRPWLGKHHSKPNLSCKRRSPPRIVGSNLIPQTPGQSPRNRISLNSSQSLTTVQHWRIRSYDSSSNLNHSVRERFGIGLVEMKCGGMPTTPPCGRSKAAEHQARILGSRAVDEGTPACLRPFPFTLPSARRLD